MPGGWITGPVVSRPRPRGGRPADLARLTSLAVGSGTVKRSGSGRSPAFSDATPACSVIGASAGLAA